LNGLDVKDDLELELRLRRIEAALEGKSNSNSDADQTSGSRSSVPQVTGLRVTGQTPGSVTVAWNPVSIPNLRRYEVDFSTAFSFVTKQTFSEVGTNRTFNTASETGGGGGTTFFARVRAVNTFGQTGPYSVTLNTVTGQAQTEDLAPGSVTSEIISTEASSAAGITYDNTTSGLAADDVQEAIDEIAEIFSESSTSAESALSTDGVVTISHGLSQTPKIVSLTLICKTAEHSFSVGDRIMASSFASNSSFVTARGWNIRVDSTNVYIDNAVGHIVVDKGGANWVTLTVGNWRWIAFCAA